MTGMKVGLLTARPLGWNIAQLIKGDADTDVVSHTHIADGWWGRAGVPLDYDRGDPPDFVLSVLWPEIIRPDALERCPHLNIHPAPLPEYRGCNSYAHAIINGETEYGVTLHYMNEGVDTGPIIDSPRFPIGPEETGKSLYSYAQVAAYLMLTRWWPVLRKGLPPATVQPEAGRYYRRDSLVPYFGSPDPVVRRALTFPPFDNGYKGEGS